MYIFYFVNTEKSLIMHFWVIICIRIFDKIKKGIFLQTKIKLKLWVKEHFNHLIEKEKTSTGLDKGWLLKMVERYSTLEEEKEEKEFLFLMKLDIRDRII